MRDVSITLESGRMLGLIGPNGAGKSTIIGGLLGLVPCEGTLEVNGELRDLRHDGVPPALRRHMAYVPEQPLYYADLTLREHVEWKQRLWRMTDVETSRVQDRVEVLVKRLSLEPHLDKFPHECSKGTLQKLMVVLALAFPFDVLVVDEPFIGLDILSIREVRSLLAEARDGGAAVLLSTHVLDWAERLCDDYLLLMDGRVLLAGTLEEMREKVGSDGASLEEIFLALHKRRLTLDAESGGA